MSSRNPKSISKEQLAYNVSRIVDENIRSKETYHGLRSSITSYQEIEESPEVAGGVKLGQLEGQELASFFYKNPSDPNVIERKPWRSDGRYFTKAYVSSISALKMASHARSGGSIEIMGMLTGKVFPHCIVVMDCYPLPVEGTETRVNAAGEAYEFMVQYLDGLKKSGRDENIVGWYHSHPGYGCWLSGIDVATQALNQQFQDPYLAIVVDPERTIANGEIEIGAFRTLPESEVRLANAGTEDDKKLNPKLKGVPESKLKDFGVHHDKYYPLEVAFFKSQADTLLVEKLHNIHNLNLIQKTDKDAEDRQAQLMIQNSKKLNEYSIPSIVVNSFPPSEAQASKKTNTLLQNPLFKLGNRNLRNEVQMVESEDEEIELSDDESKKSAGDLDDVIIEEETTDISNQQYDDDEDDVEIDAEEEFILQEQRKPVSDKLLKKVGVEVNRVLKRPSMHDIVADAGSIAVENLIELLTMDVQRDLFFEE